MKQELLVDAIGTHLDALSSLISTAIGLALLAAWAGLLGEKRVALFSLSLERRHAFYILGGSFITVNVTAILYFLRLADLIGQTEDAFLPDALTALGTNAWPYNPFAYFGPSTPSLLHSGLGYGLLILIWWIGYTALSLLVEYPMRKLGERMIMYGFLGVGLISMGAIQYVFQVITDRIRSTPTAFPLDSDANLWIRTAFTFIGIGLGALTFVLARSFRRAGPEENSPPNQAQPEQQ